MPVDMTRGLTQERLKELLCYNPLSGVFTWKVWRPNGVKVGDAAGTPRWGRLSIKVDGEAYFASRLAWFYMTGKWPVAMLDHKNLDKLDNRWENLREATRQQNSANRHGWASSGLKGAYWHAKRKRFVAVICVNYKAKTLGYFHTAEEAHAAYCRAAKFHFGEYARSA